MDNNEKKDNKILLITFISTIIYLLYLELNPKITGIWLRKNSENKLVLTLHSLKDFFAYPFKNYKMWKPNMWDMNPFVSIPIISFGIYIFRAYYNR